MIIVSSYYTFPRISWWCRVMNAATVAFDIGEHFQKMTDRNKYQVSGANNTIKLSVPILNGRNQRVPMKEVRIYNDARWQLQHWRTLVSAYKRTPYFDHYEDSLRPLFETRYSYLIDFNKAALHWAKLQLDIQFGEKETDVFVKEYPTGTLDLRSQKTVVSNLPKYYQVFEDRIGFIPDLSILDLLFSEGPGAKTKLIPLQL